MRITDYNNLKLEFGTTTVGETVGIVLKTQKEYNGAPMLGVIIPKFMLGCVFKPGDKAQEKPVAVSSKKLMNSKSIKPFFDKTCIMKNYITVYPLLNQNQSMPTYTIGDKVIIRIIDNDIKTMAFLPYSINRLGQRKTDKLQFAVPANKKENTELTEENSYIMEMDSDKDVQRIKLSTSKVNGEACAYTLLVDLKKGVAEFTDTKTIIETNFKEDSIITKTSKSSIEQVEDVVTVNADTLNLNIDSAINVKTTDISIESDTYKGEISDYDGKYDKMKIESDNGKFKIEKEVHKNTDFSIKGQSTHIDCPKVGLNGEVILPTFTIGAVPNIKTPVPKVNGFSGPNGTMLLNTCPGGMPVTLFPPLAGVLSTMAALIDVKLPIVPGPPPATTAVNAVLATMASKKILTQ